MNSASKTERERKAIHRISIFALLLILTFGAGCCGVSRQQSQFVLTEPEGGMFHVKEIESRSWTLGRARIPVTYVATKRFDLGDERELTAFLYSTNGSVDALCMEFYLPAGPTNCYVLLRRDMSSWPVEHLSVERQGERRFVSVRRSNGKKVTQYSYELSAANTLDGGMSVFYWDALTPGRDAESR